MTIGHSFEPSNTPRRYDLIHRRKMVLCSVFTTSNTPRMIATRHATQIQRPRHCCRPAEQRVVSKRHSQLALSWRPQLRKRFSHNAHRQQIRRHVRPSNTASNVLGSAIGVPMKWHWSKRQTPCLRNNGSPY
jgi:hypothetical protein